jgi:phosphonatase-like hydrolase
MILPELLVFDMAGTTIEATDLVPAAFREAFSEQEIQLGDTDISQVRGRSKPDAIFELLSRFTGPDNAKARLVTVHRRFRDLLLDCYREQGVTVITGSEDTFRWLKSHGVKIALTTGFDRELAGFLVGLAGWDKAIDTLVCGDDVEHGRPAPDLVFEAMRRTNCRDASTVAVVGDTVSDLRSAHAARAGWAIGVLSGAHGQAQLAAEAPSVILDSVGDLPAYFEQRN